jgi:hypothetical protein
MEGYDSIEFVHEQILHDAANIANQRLETEEDFERYYGEVFRPDAAERDDGLGGLALVLDESITRTLPAEKILRLHQIGTAAIRQAILRNHQGFAGAIVGLARKGENYFDRFVRPGEQRSLF